MRNPARGALIGQVVQHHELIDVLGEGGMGEVYLARHRALGMLRAFKVIHDDVKLQPSAAARFKREAQVLARLQHPNIVAVIDYGHLDNGWPYLLLEFVPGSNLLTNLRQHGPMPLATALVVLVQIARVVECAHGQGVVHRDLKPGNVLLGQGDPRQVKVIDFGMAKLLSAEMLTRLTADNQILGTPQYMAPEQANAAPEITSAADVYAVAGIAYALLSGQPVFGQRPPLALIAAQARETPKRLSTRVSIPHHLDELLYACLAKDPDARPPASTLVSELDRLLVDLGDSAAGHLQPLRPPAIPAPMDMPATDGPTIVIVGDDLDSRTGSLAGNRARPSAHELDVPAVLLSKSLAREVDVANAADIIFAPITSGSDRRVREALQNQMQAIVGELAEILAGSDQEIASSRRSITTIEEELAQFELDAALLDAEFGDTKDDALAEQRAAVALRTHQLRTRLGAEQRTLAVIVDSRRPAAPPQAGDLYRELDQMIVRAQALDEAIR